MERKENVEQYMDKAEALAKDYFRKGLNCAECVVQATMDLGLIDLPPETVAFATGFGGGIGRTRNMCGAVSGAVMAISAVKGRRNPLGKDTLQERVKELYDEKGIYSYFAAFVNEMKDEYGTLICSELSEPHGEFEGKARKRNCMQLTGYCTRLAVKYILM